MRALVRDLRYGFRSLRKSPALAIFATVALTLGIGITTTMFSIVYGALLKGLPFPDGRRIVEVSRTNLARDERHMDMPLAEYIDYRDQQRSFERFAAYTSGTMNVSGDGSAERYVGAWVSASLFSIAPAKPELGRVIVTGEDAPSGAKVAVIGYGLWKRRFGGDPSALGRVLRVNGQPFTIVGVMPEKYRFPDDAQLWLPLQDDPTVGKREDTRYVTAMGVLKSGISADQASVDVAAIAKGLQRRFPDTHEGISAWAQDYVDAEIGPEPHQLLYAMLGAVFFVLLVACANVANLLLDRAAQRSKEVGIRSALGASRTAVVRQFLAEALLLAVAGATLGTGIAYWGIAVFNRILVASTEAPSFVDIALHPMVLLFVAGIALLTTLFAGAIPALQTSRLDINKVLKDESRGSSSLHIGKLSRAIVVFEIALSCGLLVASGLMIKSVTRLKNMDPGFRTANVFTARVGFPVTYTDTVAQMRFHDRLRERLAALPGVMSATLTSSLPGVGSNGNTMMVDGQSYAKESELPHVNWVGVTPGYFETFGINAVRGRLPDEHDRADGERVLVVNEAFAGKFFPKGEALGRRIREGGLTSKEPWMTIVGVVPTAYSGEADHPRSPMYYVPMAQHHANFTSMAVRTAGPPMAITPSVREIVSALDPDIAIYRVYSMEEAYARPTWYIRTFGTMFMIFGAIALFLASMGLYAVMSFSVNRRTREMGIRMALGARGGSVVRLIFRQGLAQISVGLVLGLALAAVLAQFTQIILFEVKPRDPVIFGGVVGLLATVGVVACLVPARRATRVDPMVALRAE